MTIVAGDIIYVCSRKLVTAIGSKKIITNVDSYCLESAVYAAGE